MSLDWKAWLALSVFTVQSGCTPLILRFATSQVAPYSTAVAVLLMELAVKLPIATVLYTLECGGVRAMARALFADARERPGEWAKLAVPALLYTVTNNLMYVGFANVEAAVGQATIQVKIFFTAVFSVALLGKRLSPNQWLSLGILAAGVIGAQGKARGKAAGRVQSLPLGLGALLVGVACSAFASVYFEKMLKGGGRAPSLWLRNIQMSLYGAAVAALGVALIDDAQMAREGPMYGFGAWAWACTVWQGAGGLLVAVTLKYADNILRAFAQGLALIVAAIGSYFLFDFHVTPRFVGGVGMVICAIFLYGGKHQTPQQLCASLCGCMAGEPEAEAGAALLGEAATTPPHTPSPRLNNSTPKNTCSATAELLAPTPVRQAQTAERV